MAESMEFQLVTSKRRRPTKKSRPDSDSSYSNDDSSSQNDTIRTCSRTSTPIPPTRSPTPEQQPQQQLYTASVSNLPQHARTIKGLAPYLHRIHDLKIDNVIPLRSGMMLIKSYDPATALKLRKLRQIIDVNIIIAEMPTRLSQLPPRKEPSLSCVITSVDKDISMPEIEDHLKSQQISYKSLWRIKSRLTNEETRLVRVVTNSKESLDRMLTQGVVIYYKRHRTEPSHPPTPQPYQCPRCLAFHEPGTCRSQIKCRMCAGNHKEAQCKLGDKPKVCGNCGGDHPATSHRCPSRPKAPATTTATAHIRVLEPTRKEESAPPSTADVLRFMTATIINAMPDQKPRLQSILTNLAATIFNTKMVVSYSGTKMHISCAPLRARHSYAAATSNSIHNG